MKKRLVNYYNLFMFDTFLVRSLNYRTQVTENGVKLLSEPRKIQVVLWRKVQKEEFKMKKFLNKDVLVSGGLIVLGLAQMVLSNKKQASEINALESKVTEKVMKNLTEQKQN